LGKTHAIELIETGKGSNTMIAVIAIDACFEMAGKWSMICENTIRPWYMTGSFRIMEAIIQN
jgi:hypothetical protein